MRAREALSQVTTSRYRQRDEKSRSTGMARAFRTCLNCRAAERLIAAPIAQLLTSGSLQAPYEQGASLFQRVFFTAIYPLLLRGNEAPLEHDDLYQLPRGACAL